MVPVLTIVFLAISALICFIVPLLLFLRIKKHSNQLLVPVIAGAVGFFVMQMIIRIPLLALFDFTDWNIYATGIFLGFTAALFETVGRFLTMKFLMKDDRRFFAGFAHGIGHGGIEAILLVGINYIVYIYFAILINTNNFPAIGLGSQSIVSITEVLIDNPSGIFLVAGFERVVTILLHICLSILTIFAIKKKDYKYLLIVLGIHTIVDFGAVVLMGSGVSVYLVELFVLIMLICTSFIVMNVYNEYKREALEEGETND